MFPPSALPTLNIRSLSFPPKPKDSAEETNGPEAPFGFGVEGNLELLGLGGHLPQHVDGPKDPSERFKATG